jgi:acetoin utilization protein AcuB
MAKKRAKKSSKPRTAKPAVRKRKPASRRAAAPKKPTKAATSKAASKGASSVAGVAEHMTRSPHTIGRDQTLALAHELMNKHRIRHLPVLEGGQLVGILSQRDLYFVESLDASSPSEVKVEEAMTQEVFEVDKGATLVSVIATMVQHKHGCAVVTEGGKVAGVFSTIDALRVLLHTLR